MHVARFVLLYDETLDDLAVYGTSFPEAPVWLVLLGDCDGAVDSMLQQFAATAEPGLRQSSPVATTRQARICLAWMRGHSVQPAAQYINWLGRTVQQIRKKLRYMFFCATTSRGLPVRRSTLRGAASQVQKGCGGIGRAASAGR